MSDVTPPRYPQAVPADQPWGKGQHRAREPEVSIPVTTMREVNAAIRAAHKAGPNVVLSLVALVAVVCAAYMFFRADPNARLDAIERRLDGMSERIDRALTR